MGTVPYVPTLTACTPIPVFWFSHYVMVEWFGAAADGVTNDTNAFVRALADGRPIALDGRKSYAVSNVIIDQTMTCPGIFSIGGKARIVPATTDASNGRCFYITKPADFLVDGLFFDLPISTDPLVAPSFNRAVYFSPTGNTGTNYRVQNCKFVGGTVAVVMGGILRNCRIDNNYITATWGEGISAQALDNCHIGGNILEDGGYATGGPQPAGAIRIGYSLQLAVSRNVTISGNTIARYCVNAHQSSIDCFSGAGRGFAITNNVIDMCGGSIELKTADWALGTPDVYRPHLVADNMIRMDASDAFGGCSAITLFYASPSTVLGKAGATMVSGNTISGDVPPSDVVGVYGVVVVGWDDVTIANNKMLNVNHGITFGGTGETDATAYRLVISGNTIDSTGGVISRDGGGGTIVGLQIVNNPRLYSTSSTSNAIVLTPGTIQDMELSGNYIEATAAAALDLRDIHASRLVRNTIKASGTCIVFQGTASDSTVISRNRLISAAGPAVNVGSGTSGIAVQGNDVDVPVTSYTVTGSGTWTAADNNRGMAATIPTGGGSLGDTFSNSAAASGGYGKWRCTTAGGAGSAVWKGTEAIA